MACIHLQKLYDLCQEHEMRFQLSSSDLIRIVCKECGSQDVCPTTLRDELGSAEETDEASPPKGG